MSDHVDMPFCFAVRRRWFPPSGENARNGVEVAVLESGVIRIPVIDVGDTALVARLNRYTDAKGLQPRDQFDLRMVDGRLMRPVFRPEVFKPCDVEAFARFASAGPAWRDSPFLTHPSRDKKPIGLRQFAKPESMFPAHRWADVAEAEQERSAVRRRAAALVIIDGLVYCPTDEPRLRILKDWDRETGAGGLTWSFHSFSGYDYPMHGSDQKLIPEMGDYPWNVGLFRLDREADARRFAQALCMSGDRPRNFRVDTPPVVEDLDPSLLRRREDIFSTLQGLKSLFSADRGLRSAWAPLLGASVEALTAFGEARDIVHSFEGPVEEADLRAVFERLDIVLRGIPEKFDLLGVDEAILRWRVCERDRVAPSPIVMGPDDEDAIGTSFAP